MKIQVEINDKNYRADLNQAHSIAITLLPNGEQPSHFGAPACTSETLQGGGFVGDTRRGGSCNVNTLTIVPHCNGTHTESIAHIVNQKVAVYQAATQPFFATTLISIKPCLATETDDQYIPGFDPTNRVISRSHLEEKLRHYSDLQLAGLVIRTLPNHQQKKSSVYDDDNYPVYLTNDAMRYLVERQVQHLMVDFPSLDKMYDEGKLSNHRLFWNVALDSKEMSPQSFTHKTISEMVFVNDEVKDGFYLCNLQLPEINTDAVPSRPILIELIEI